MGLLNGGCTIHSNTPGDATLKSLDKSKQAVASRVIEGGQELTRIELPLGADSFRRCDLATAFGMNPVRHLDRFMQYNHEAETRVTYSKLPGLDVWYPKSIVFDSRMGDREAVFEQIDIKLAEFGGTIPDAVFTLAGMELERGQAIGFPEIKKHTNYPLWDGTKPDFKRTLGIAAAEAHEFMLEQAEPRPPVPDARPVAWPKYAAAALAVLAVSAFVLARRRR